jgi:hypothetical protein
MILIAQSLRQKSEYAAQQIKYHFVFRISFLRIEAAVQITSGNTCIVIKLNPLLDLFTVGTDNSDVTLETVLFYDESGVLASFART